jgi:hypothetical protein
MLASMLGDPMQRLATDPKEEDDEDDDDIGCRLSSCLSSTFQGTFGLGSL